MFHHLLGSRLRLMLRLMDVLLRFGFSGRTTWIWPLGLISDGSDGATLLLWLLLNNFLGETSVLNGFVWSVAISAPSSLFLALRVEGSDSAQLNSLFSAKFWLRIPMFDEISIHLFCHSLGSRLRLLLRLVKVLLEFGLSRHSARDCRLGWFRDGSDCAIPLLRLLVKVGYVEKAWNDRFVATLVWSFSPAWEAVELTPWRGGRLDGAEGAISPKQFTCLYWALNEAIVCVYCGSKYGLREYMCIPLSLGFRV